MIFVGLLRIECRKGVVAGASRNVVWRWRYPALRVDEHDVNLIGKMVSKNHRKPSKHNKYSPFLCTTFNNSLQHLWRRRRRQRRWLVVSLRAPWQYQRRRRGRNGSDDGGQKQRIFHGKEGNYLAAAAWGHPGEGQDSTSRGRARGESTPRGIPSIPTMPSPRSSNL